MDSMTKRGFLICWSGLTGNRLKNASCIWACDMLQTSSSSSLGRMIALWSHLFALCWDIAFLSMIVLSYIYGCMKFTLCNKVRLCLRVAISGNAFDVAQFLTFSPMRAADQVVRALVLLKLVQEGSLKCRLQVKKTIGRNCSLAFCHHIQFVQSTARQFCWPPACSIMFFDEIQCLSFSKH